MSEPPSALEDVPCEVCGHPGYSHRDVTGPCEWNDGCTAMAAPEGEPDLEGMVRCTRCEHPAYRHADLSGACELCDCAGMQPR